MNLANNQQAFIMQLSSFDSSHKSRVVGTPEVLIPHPAVNFFPQISNNGRKYPDVYFNVTLHTNMGCVTEQFRFWYYEERATGKRIDEYRLRMTNRIVDLMSSTGGDLLVITKTLSTNSTSYDVEIINQSDPNFHSTLSLCNQIVYEKVWGIV